jgi:DNA polymerase-3 subunit alpha
VPSIRCNATAPRWRPAIDRAFDFANATAANVHQGGLFDLGGDDDHGSSTQEPELVDATPWGVKEQLTLEKTAIGFYLSGHLFDEVAREVRQLRQAAGSRS